VTPLSKSRLTHLEAARTEQSQFRKKTEKIVVKIYSFRKERNAKLGDRIFSTNHRAQTYALPSPASRIGSTIVPISAKVKIIVLVQLLSPKRATPWNEEVQRSQGANKCRPWSSERKESGGHFRH
jgi:hypothetical protein